MDDWLVTPAFSLERGAVYKFQLDAKTVLVLNGSRFLPEMRRLSRR